MKPIILHADNMSFQTFSSFHSFLFQNSDELIMSCLEREFSMTKYALVDMGVYIQNLPNHVLYVVFAKFYFLINSDLSGETLNYTPMPARPISVHNYCTNYSEIHISLQKI